MCEIQFESSHQRRFRECQNRRLALHWSARNDEIEHYSHKTQTQHKRYKHQTQTWIGSTNGYWNNRQIEITIECQGNFQQKNTNENRFYTRSLSLSVNYCTYLLIWIENRCLEGKRAWLREREAHEIGADWLRLKQSNRFVVLRDHTNTSTWFASVERDFMFVIEYNTLLLLLLLLLLP